MRPPEELDELVCPMSRGALERKGTALHCPDSGRSYPIRADWIDFLPGQEEDSHSVASALMHLPAFARFYEGYWRPTFVSVTRGERSDIEREMGWIERELDDARGGKILDLSCGPGTVGRRLSMRGQFERVFLLDHSEAMLSQAARFVEDDGLEDVWIVRADGAYLPFADGSLDAVHAGHAMYLWENPDHVLSEVARVLRPGGVFVASTFVVEDEGVRDVAIKAMAAVSRMEVTPEQVLRNRCEAMGLKEYRANRQGQMVRFRVERSA